jgi:putative MATE family efflux protein
MGVNKVKNQKLTLFALLWPIFIEMSLRMMMGNADTLMLSAYSDDAVAATGVANQLLGIAVVMFGFVAMGSGIVVSQYLGAKEQEKAREVIVVGIAVNLLFGLLLSGVMVLFGPQLLKMVGLPPELMDDAMSFMLIVGGLSFFEAVSITTATIIRSHGYTKDAMFVTIGINVLNVVGNYFVLFGPYDLPVHGVTGVACSTAFARIVGMAVLLYILYRRVDGKLPWARLLTFPRDTLRNILRIGLPAAGEILSYQGSQVAITSFVTQLGTEALTTKIYTQNIMMFIYLFTLSVGQATQILVGHQIGAGEKEAAYERCMKSVKVSFAASLGMACLFALFRHPLLGIFTTNQAIIDMGSTLLLLTIILEPGRVFNLVVIASLRAAGDAKFPVVMGVLSMWGISLTLSWLLGIHFGLGLVGLWIAFAADEWFRGVFMLWRWRSRKWEKMSFVKPVATEEQAVSGA